MYDDNKPIITARMFRATNPSGTPGSRQECEADTPAAAHRKFKELFPRVRLVSVIEYTRKNGAEFYCCTFMPFGADPGMYQDRRWYKLRNDGSGGGLPETADHPHEHGNITADAATPAGLRP